MIQHSFSFMAMEIGDLHESYRYDVVDLKGTLPGVFQKSRQICSLRRLRESIQNKF